MIDTLPPEVIAQILEASPLRIFWKDRDSLFLGCNQRFADDAGIADPREFVGKSDFYFYHPEQAAAFRADDADVMFNGLPKAGIVESLTLTDGQVMWVETSKFPLHGENGEIVGVLGLYLDVTERDMLHVRRAAALSGDGAGRLLR